MLAGVYLLIFPKQFRPLKIPVFLVISDIPQDEYGPTMRFLEQGTLHRDKF